MALLCVISSREREREIESNHKQSAGLSIYTTILANTTLAWLSNHKLCWFSPERRLLWPGKPHLTLACTSNALKNNSKNLRVVWSNAKLTSHFINDKYNRYLSFSYWGYCERLHRTIDVHFFERFNYLQLIKVNYDVFYWI